MSVPEYFIGHVYAWLADEDTARPIDVLTEPVADWVLLGTGTNAMPVTRLSDDAVTWEVNQTVNPERDLNEVFPSDAFRVEADQMISFSLRDFRAEVISKALNNADVDTIAASPTIAGAQEIGVNDMGVAVAKMALLVRVDSSPYIAVGGGYWSEFWGPSVYEASNFTTVLGSRAISMVPFQFMSVLSGLAAYKTANTRMGSWKMQNAVRS